MDDFVPPKPPEGVDIKKEDVDSGNKLDNELGNELDNEVSVEPGVGSGKKLSKKGRGIFKKLFGRSSSKKTEESVSDAEPGSSVQGESSELLVESSDGSELFSEQPDYDFSSKTEEESDFSSEVPEKEADGAFLDDSGKDVKISDDSFLNTELKEAPEQYVNDAEIAKEDLDNIRAALGVYKKGDKSIREKFEEDPDSFSSDDEWGQVKQGEEHSDYEDSEESLFVRDVDSDVLDDSKSEASGFDEPVDDSKSEASGFDEPVDDLPSFDSKSKGVDSPVEKGLVGEYSSKASKVANKNKGLTEKKIESLIKNVTLKKKKSILDRDREAALLLTFERDVKKIVAQNLKSFELEEKKFVDKIEKKAKVLGKKESSLKKKDQRIKSEEKKIAEKSKELEKAVEVSKKVVADLEKSIGVLEKKREKSDVQVNDLEVKKNALKKEISELKDVLKSEKKRLDQELDSLKLDFDNKKGVLLKESVELEKSVTKIKKELEKASKDLVSVKDDVKEQLASLSVKERELDKKSKDLKKLIEEERKIFELLSNANKSGSVGEERVQRSSVSGSFVSVNDFLDRIDECSELVRRGAVDEAKHLYNEVRDDFVGASLSDVDKKNIREKLKALFEIISKS